MVLLHIKRLPLHWNYKNAKQVRPAAGVPLVVSCSSAISYSRSVVHSLTLFSRSVRATPVRGTMDGLVYGDGFRHLAWIAKIIDAARDDQSNHRY